MKTKSLIFAVTFILSLALLSCAYASDANETVIEDDYSIIEDDVVHEENVVFGDEIADASLPDDEMVLEEGKPVEDIAVDNKSYTTSEIVDNNIEHGEECDFVAENYETPNIGLFNDGQFFDIESDEKFDATFNNNILITSFVELNISLDDIECFEFFPDKMEDFDSSLVREGKIKNSFAFKHELMVHVLHDHNFENCLDFDIVICSNKLSDNFAYSINNSVIGDGSGVIYCIFNSSYFINQNDLFFNYNFYSSVSVFFLFFVKKI